LAPPRKRNRAAAAVSSCFAVARCVGRVWRRRQQFPRHYTAGHMRCCQICSLLRPQLSGQMGKCCDQDGSSKMRAFGMSTMQYCGTSFARIALTSLFGTLTAFGLNGAVLAAGTCIEGPNLNAGQGHWYYRADRINHRKCWYVMETELKTHDDQPLGPTPSQTSPPNLTFFSWLTSGAPSAGMQPTNTPESRAPPAAVRTLKVVRAVAKNEQWRPARAASAVMRSGAKKESLLPPVTPRGTLKIAHLGPNERSRLARPPAAKGVASAERNQQSASRLSTKHAEQVNSQPPDQAAQDALFLEFLRWKELQKSSK